LLSERQQRLDGLLAIAVVCAFIRYELHKPGAQLLLTECHKDACNGFRQASFLHGCADSKGKGNAHLRPDSTAAAVSDDMVSQGMAEAAQGVQNQLPLHYSKCAAASAGFEELTVPSLVFNVRLLTPAESKHSRKLTTRPSPWLGLLTCT
jgi:hypothetical protein